ncbi:MAG: hypothetical protein RH982_02765 [Parvibaculum sp.]
MACCAFAVLLLGQLLLPFRRFRGWLFGAPAARPDAAAGWTPGASPPPALPRARFALKRGFAVVAALELALLSGVALGGIALPASAGEGTTAALLADIDLIHTTICRAVGIGA